MLGQRKANFFVWMHALCIRYSCACIHNDVFMWQMYAYSVHLFVIRQKFPLTFAHLTPSWRTLANGKQTWPNMFVHVCCEVHTSECTHLLVFGQTWKEREKSLGIVNTVSFMRLTFSFVVTRKMYFFFFFFFEKYVRIKIEEHKIFVLISKLSQK